MKYSCVLILLKSEFLDMSVKVLNPDSTDLVEIFTDGYDKPFLKTDEKNILVSPFLEIMNRINKYKNFKWLIIGDNNDTGKVKKFLLTLDIDSSNILAFDLTYEMSPKWIANYKYLEKNGADFFATGNEFTVANLNFHFIPLANKDKNLSLVGVHLGENNQDLQTSYFIAQNIFNTVKKGTIKFVLIGLLPDSFQQDSVEDFFNLKYLFFLKMLSVNLTTVEKVKEDLDFDKVSISYYRNFSMNALTDWNDTSKIFSDNSVEKNVQILKDYINLCIANNAKPIGVVFPIAPAARKIYDKKILDSFREIIHKLEESTPFVCVDMFDLNIGYDCFCDMTHMNFKGSETVNSMLSLKLYQNGCIPIENFLDRVYTYFDRMSHVVSKDVYNELMKRIFDLSAKMIGRKEKIKVGFLLYLADFWCGDDLYNLFANDERFEVTVFFGWATLPKNPTESLDTMLRSFEKFKSYGINVVLMDNLDAKFPIQDILFYLSPFSQWFARIFQLSNTKLSSLILYVPYSMNMLTRQHYEPRFFNETIFRTAYKVFSTSNVEKKVFQSYCATGLPNAIYSGHPKMDFFLNQTDCKFEWKMARPNAKKIIYAPHWNFKLNGTFPYNHQHIYEFVKAHPEVCFVFKPHPNLIFSTIDTGLFSTVEDYKEYLQKWDDLPNAKVYTGAYYQDIFATSDGMIQDSVSFIGEYQYVNKPMIFTLGVNKSKATFNELGKGILNVSYCVDGKDWDAVSAMMQKVFIEGNDYKAEERKKFFDENLNYFKQNGMSASKFIYKTICKDLGIKTS